MRADTVKNENGNALRSPMERLNTFSHGLAFRDHMLGLKTLTVMLPRNSYSLNRQVNRTRYVVESTSKTFCSFESHVKVAKAPN